jgi:peptidyl-prolyl cis-trans isomerase A (cyclophilin A)
LLHEVELTTEAQRPQRYTEDIMREPKNNLLFLLCALCVSVVSRTEAQAGPHVLITTTLGDIEILVDSAHAPLTSANFLRYVDLGFYGNFGRFHRTVRADNQPDSKVKIAVVQAGLAPYRAQGFPPITLERTNLTGLHHLDGTVSMARDGPNTATSDFFICIGNQPALDYGGKRNQDGQGFAAFGRVVSGMEVVKKIQESQARGQNLTPPIRILKATRVAPVRPSRSSP